MSNHTVIDCATNGNNTSNNSSSGSSNVTKPTATTTNSMSINSHKNETKINHHQNTQQLTTLPEKNILSHRRELSIVQQQQQQHDKQRQHQQQQQHNHKETRKFIYLKPQTYPHNEQNLVDSSSLLSENLNKPDKSDKREEDETFLVYSDNHIISGHLNSLITHLVPTNDYYPDHQYIVSFILCARLFLRPHELLAQISQIWENQQIHHQTQTNDVVDEANFRHLTVTTSVSPQLQRKQTITTTTTTNNDEQQQTSQQRNATQKSAQNCIRLLSDWIETFPYDFRDERLMEKVRIIARKCVYIDNALGKQVSRILQSLVQRLTALENYEEFLQSLLINDLNTSQHQHYSTSASASFSVTNIAAQHNSLSKSAIAALNSGDGNKTGHSILSPVANITSNPTDVYDVYGIMSLCPSCEQLAHQLTSIELERASNIGPEEFVQAFAKEYHQQTIANTSNATTNTNGIVISSSMNDIKKTRNLESYVEWFNRLSYLTASEIVKFPKKKQRVRIIEYWIETARECFNIGNFNSLMAIIAGLNLAPISRLKKTWSKVQLAKFSVLEHQMDPTSNFNSYRSTLKAAMWRSEGATEERERIIIPFFSLFVKDLYFLNESCSNRLPNNHINFEKCTQLAKQVMEFNEWKKVPCPFEKLPNVIQYLQTHPVLNENTLSMASFECEPPENTEEKGRYKTVKAETKQQLLQQLQQEQQTQH